MSYTCDCENQVAVVVSSMSCQIRIINEMSVIIFSILGPVDGPSLNFDMSVTG